MSLLRFGPRQVAKYLKTRCLRPREMHLWAAAAKLWWFKKNSLVTWVEVSKKFSNLVFNVQVLGALCFLSLPSCVFVCLSRVWVRVYSFSCLVGRINTYEEVF